MEKDLKELYKEINFWNKFNIKNINSLKRYIKFINNFENRPKPNIYCERHHVIPNSFMNNNFKIYLTAREHYIAHILLAKAFEDKMILALKRMTIVGKNKYCINSKDYKRLKELDRIYYSSIAKNSWNTGRLHGFTKDEKTKLKMSISAKNSWKLGRKSKTGKYIQKLGLPCIIYDTKVFDEINQKLIFITHAERKFKLLNQTKGKNNPNYGNRSKYMNKDGKNKMVKYEDIDKYLSLGYSFEMITKSRKGKNNPNYGNKWSTEQQTKFSNYRKEYNKKNPRIWIHKDNKTKMILYSEINQYIKGGWQYGRK